jgi:hypothetical protein
MWQTRSPVRPRADVLALQLNAERAGLSWACPFASSDEFEAAVISARRRAGAYRRDRSRSLIYVAVVCATMLGAYLLF